MTRGTAEEGEGAHNSPPTPPPILTLPFTPTRSSLSVFNEFIFIFEMETSLSRDIECDVQCPLLVFTSLHSS